MAHGPLLPLNEECVVYHTAISNPARRYHSLGTSTAPLHQSYSSEFSTNQKAIIAITLDLSSTGLA